MGGTYSNRINKKDVHKKSSKYKLKPVNRMNSPESTQLTDWVEKPGRERTSLIEKLAEKRPVWWCGVWSTAGQRHWV